jgi:hypothetical protein
VDDPIADEDERDSREKPDDVSKSAALKSLRRLHALRRMEATAI